MRATESTKDVTRTFVKQEKEVTKQQPAPQPLVTGTIMDKNKQESNDVVDRVFKCEHEGCTSSFKTRSSLRDHQKVHSEDR